MDEKVSKRLAVLNLDWDQINAKDLMALFASLCKEGNKIEKVEIYPSEYGKEQMKNDSLYGPQGIWANSKVKPAIFDQKKEKTEEAKKDAKNPESSTKPEPSKDSELSKDLEPSKEEPAAAAAEHDSEEEEHSEEDEESDDGNDDPTKPQKAAVAPQQPPISAPRQSFSKKGKKDFEPIALRKYELQKLRYFFAVVYCDSISSAQQVYEEYDGFEYENSSFKLDLRFIPDELKFPDPPKEVCTKLESGYEPKLLIVNSAVQQSQVKLTWEAPDTKRYELINKRLNPDKLEEMDLKDYLGSGSEEEEDGDADKYRKLLSFTQTEEGIPSSKGKDGRKKADDVHITFKSGLEEEDEIPDNTKEERNSEKEQADKKGKRKFAEKKHFKHKADVVEGEEAGIDKRAKEELELLIDRKKGAEDFKIDLNDQRFKSLYKDKRYLIDPSSKDYKKAGKDFRQEQIKKKKKLDE